MRKKDKQWLAHLSDLELQILSIIHILRLWNNFGLKVGENVVIYGVYYYNIVFLLFVMHIAYQCITLVINICKSHLTVLMCYFIKPQSICTWRNSATGIKFYALQDYSYQFSPSVLLFSIGKCMKERIR